jgi:hypothetical protein
MGLFQAFFWRRRYSGCPMPSSAANSVSFLFFQSALSFLLAFILIPFSFKLRVARRKAKPSRKSDSTTISMNWQVSAVVSPLASFLALRLPGFRTQQTFTLLNSSQKTSAAN